MVSDQEQWYTNKELFEQINTMRNEFKDLSAEMRETREMIKRYNGLREEVGGYQKAVEEYRKEIEELKEKIGALEAKAEGRLSVWEGIRNWGALIVGVAGFCFGVFEFLSKH